MLKKVPALEERVQQSAHNSQPPPANDPVLTVQDGFVYEDYSSVVPEPMELDNEWLDVTQNKAAPSRDMVIIHALRDLRLSR